MTWGVKGNLDNLQKINSESVAHVFLSFNLIRFDLCVHRLKGGDWTVRGQ